MKQRFVIFAALTMSLMLSMSAFGAVSYVSSGDSGADGSEIASGQTNGGAKSGNGSLAPNATPVPTTKSFNILKNPSWADLGNSGFSPLPVPYTTNWVSFLSSPTPGSAIGNSNLTTGVEQWVDFYHVFNIVGPVFSGDLKILADDRADIFLNGKSPLNPVYTTPQGGNATCNTGVVGCLGQFQGNFDIKNFLVTGKNTLVVRVYQDNGGDFGTAYLATINAVPEPGFYGMLSLGLGGLLVAVQRRRKNAVN